MTFGEMAVAFLLFVNGLVMTGMQYQDMLHDVAWHWKISRAVTQTHTACFLIAWNECEPRHVSSIASPIDPLFHTL
ncbi:hypothetical protein F4819DRAFT_460120 [Hypoxylon fuscum]|nr:hypothetical protein F4819DRAFT_460120 [Hypoxylon fuscum]